MTSISIKSLQRVDKLLGPAACCALQPLRLVRERAIESPAKKVLAIKFWGIGSLQMLTPAIATLRRRHPFAEITLLTLAGNRDFAERLAIFDRVMTLDVAGIGWFRIGARIVRLLRELRAQDFDVVYDFEFFTRFSAVVAIATGAPRRHGFASPSVWRGSFHTEEHPYNRYWHVARNFRVLAGGENGLNVISEDLKPLSFNERDEARAFAALARRGLRTDEPYCVLNVNAGELSLERRWPPGQFVELAQRFITVDQWQVVLIGSAPERAYTDGVAARVANSRCSSVAGELRAGELAAVFAHAAVVVSNDSGPMHIAAALDVPTVGLFGPETPVMYAPIGLRTRALYRPPACSPCINVHENKVASCIWGEPQCLVGISVQDVHDAARSLVSGVDFEAAPISRIEQRDVAAQRDVSRQVGSNAQRPALQQRPAPDSNDTRRPQDPKN